LKILSVSWKRNSFREELNMSFAMVAAGGVAAAGGIAGSIISSNAAKDAAQTQADAANQASQLQYNEFQQQQANQQPWLNAGASALPQLSQMARSTPQFTQQDFQNNMDPAYQFDLNQGLQAIQRSAAAKGGLMSGGTLKSLNDYAQGQASNEYQNSYNRFMNNQNTQFNRLASLAGLGQTANGAIGQAGMNMANNVGNNIMGAANASGAAQIASGNAIGSTLGSLGTGLANNYMQYNMMNKLFPNGMGGGGGGGFSLPTPSPYQYQSGSGLSLLAGD
jgi:uncharacterized protein YcbK (DUF882 family)